jgi:radical SAM superfamily enzyme YgiQ (UPF0313 family)
MKVLLVSTNSERINMVTVPLGLGLVAAATRRAGHEVELLDLMSQPDPLSAVRSAIARFTPDAIGISVRNIDDQCRDNPRFLLEPSRAVVEACRACSQAKIIVGGAGYSIFPREALAFLGADFGVAGDGETAFPALLEQLARGEGAIDLPGVFRPSAAPKLARATCDDLDSLPLWDESLDHVVAGADLWVPVQTRRGCPNDCSYCSTALVQGRAIRTRSIEGVVAQIARLSQRGARRFFFVDNSFNLPERHALDLCAALARLEPRPTWRCILYPELVRPELVRAMAQAGCTEVSLGFESGNPRVLREMNKRFTPDDVRRTADLLEAFLIRRMGFLLLGGPSETRESVEESLAFARSLHLDELRITVGIRVYPGTPLAKRALAEKVIASEDELLSPRFYLAPGLEPWIRERVARESQPG